jgi:hypothetical protein
VKEVLEKNDSTTKKSYWVGKLSAGGKSTDRVLGLEEGALKGWVRIEVSALGKYHSVPSPIHPQCSHH